MLRQLQRELVPFPGVDFRFVFFQPSALEDFVLLEGTDRGHVIPDNQLRHFLVGRIQRQPDVVAVGCRFPGIHHAGNAGHLVAFHYLIPFAQGGIRRKIILHGILNAVTADDIIVGISLGGKLEICFPARNRTGISDNLGSQGMAGINPLGAVFNAHAHQHTRPGFDFCYGINGYILRDDNGHGVENIHLHFGIDRHDLEHAVFRDLGPVDLVAGAEQVNALLRCLVAGRSGIVVGTPLPLARIQDRVRNTASEIEFPFTLLAPADHVTDTHGSAVFFDDINGIIDGFGIQRIERLGIGGSILLECNVVNQLVLRQDYRVGRNDRPAFAAQVNRFGFGAFRFFLMNIRLVELEPDQTGRQPDENEKQHNQERGITPEFRGFFLLFFVLQQSISSFLPVSRSNQRFCPIGWIMHV